MKDVLIINSFGGSLLAAAMQQGLPIRGSYETAGYGTAVQKYNAPNVRFIEKQSDWPAQDLSDTMVIGHPPCSAFSTLNTAMRQKMKDDPSVSVNSPAFKCTKDLLDYAMGSGAQMVLIESVPRAMVEAAAIHDSYAEKFGYSLFRIIQSSKYFGLPQNRKRFWAVFTKGRGAQFEVGIPNIAPPSLPDFIKQEGEPFPDHVKALKRLTEIALERIPDDEFRAMLTGEYGFGKLRKIIAEAREAATGLEYGPEFAKKVVSGRWDVSSLTILDPEESAPVVIGSCLWMFRDKLLTFRDYARVMGFPDWYSFPERMLKSGNETIGYLSRGVCPPVAEWLLQTFFKRETGGWPTVTIKDGETLDTVEYNKALTKPVKSDKGIRGPREKKIVHVLASDGFNPLAPRAIVSYTPETVEA
jgi:site-specific DNA-cytosine methylase